MRVGLFFLLAQSLLSPNYNLFIVITAVLLW
jgi:hypothetical protein